MIRLVQRLKVGNASARLTLPWDKRVKARLRVTLDDGRDAGLFLDRGPILRGGDLLASEEGEVIEVLAAAETVSQVQCGDPLLFARACYHLGNRHTPLQILADELRYQHDHVLDDMVMQLGLVVSVAEKPFEPEAGAYGEHASGHAHGHSHSHGQIHAHSDGHNHGHG